MALKTRFLGISWLAYKLKCEFKSISGGTESRMWWYAMHSWQWHCSNACYAQLDWEGYLFIIILLLLVWIIVKNIYFHTYYFCVWPTDIYVMNVCGSFDTLLMLSILLLLLYWYDCVLCPAHPFKASIGLLTWFHGVEPPISQHLDHFLTHRPTPAKTSKQVPSLAKQSINH